MNLTDYIEQREARLADKEIRDLALFGELGGMLLCLFGVWKWLGIYSVIKEILIGIPIILGAYMFIGGLIYPLCLRWVYKAASFLGDKVGLCVIRLLLAVVYALFVIPVGLVLRRKGENYGCYQWEDAFADGPSTEYVPHKQTERQQSGKRFALFKSLLRTFVMNGHSLFIPLVIVLAVLGIIFFFVTTSVFAPMIYTLF